MDEETAELAAILWTVWVRSSVVNEVEGELVGTGTSEVEMMGVSEEVTTAASTVGSAEGVVVEVQVVVSTTRLTVKVV
jgi:hypothetical protein